MSNSKYKRGIDITISILKKEYPFILGWRYNKDNDYRHSIYIDIVVDMKKTSEFYGSPIKPYYMNIDSDEVAAYPFSVLEITSELNSDEKYELYKNIVVDLDEIYDQIPDDYKDTFESEASDLTLTKDLYIESFIFEKPNKSITESKQKSNYLNMIKNFVKSYKDRDYVCDVEVLYDEEDDYYVVTLFFDLNEIHKMYVSRDISDLRLELTRDVKNYIPIPNIYVGSSGRRGCGEKNINESMSDKNKINLVKKIIYDFDEVSFIKQSTYNDRPLLTVYFNSDDTAANIESWFTHQICDTVKNYTSGEIKCNPSWGPEWRTNRNNPDILIDTILLEYDDEGNVLNENYSPAGKEITPNRIVIHKSTPKNRDRILEQGLKVRAGECYKTYAGYGEKCIPAIFATNTTNKRAWFDSTYDDDIWEIDTTMIPEVKWYKDNHYEPTKKHIVTFENIPSEALTLKYEGTGESKQKSNYI